jgi:hydrogenase maturation protease
MNPELCNAEFAAPQVLIAGAGNIFLGDDGFGVEVVGRLARETLPHGVIARDYGIRGLHLAFELLEPPGLLIVVDAVSRGEPPGTLYVIEPDDPGRDSLTSPGDPHGMNLPAVFAQVTAMGGALPKVLIVGCEPAILEESIGLSAPVEDAVEPAIHMVRTIVQRQLEATARDTAKGDRP